jgi:predicted nucleic acid-binding protein
MILYLEPSSMFKLYIEETDSGTVEALFRAHDEIATSSLSYAEMRAALAAAARGRRISPEQYPEVLAAFESDWIDLIQVAPSAGLIARAGTLAEQHALKGYDAVHLASVLFLRDETGAAIQCCTHDQDLFRAVEREGVAAIGPSTP